MRTSIRIATKTAALLGWLLALPGALLHAPGATAQSPSRWLDRYDFHEPAVELHLPGRLREISGLAITADGRVLAHDDERGVVYEVDIRNGELIKAFAFGDPPVRQDFEGIAVARDRVYLVTSGGTIYESREGGNDDRLLFNTYGTGLGRRCEVEGLAYEPARDALLLVCKNPRDAGLEGVIAIFRFSLEARELVGSPVLIDMDALARPIGKKRFQPSGIEWLAETGTYLLVAGLQAAIAEVTPAGEVLDVRALSPGRHPQAEGVSVTSDGWLLIADEGRGRRARLTAYAPVPGRP